MAWKGFSRAAKEDPSGVTSVLAVTISATPERLALSPDVREELAWIIEKESAWNPTAVNMVSNATGLIQFMPSTAKDLGTTVEALRAMSRAEQAPWVQKFFDRVTNKGKKKVRRVGDVYLLTFNPGHVGDDDSAVLYEVGTTGWLQNPGLREGKTGPITAGTVRRAGTPSSSLPGVGPGPVPAKGSSVPNWVWLLLALYVARKAM